MITKSKLTTVLVACIVSIIMLEACKKEKEVETIVPEVPVTDSALYEMAKTTNGYVWYKHTNALLKKSAGSGHTPTYLRTRLNSIAASKLDNTGKVMLGSIFPEGSLILKELHSDSVTLVRYVIMYKKTRDVNADANGWLWAYINPDGKTAISIAEKGAQCISCHAQSGNINNILMNQAFP
jgi:hypothetical protein